MRRFFYLSFWYGTTDVELEPYKCVILINSDSLMLILAIEIRN